jgi:hypothetical protein
MAFPGRGQNNLGLFLIALAAVVGFALAGDFERVLQDSRGTKARLTGDYTGEHSPDTLIGNIDRVLGENGVAILNTTLANATRLIFSATAGISDEGNP